MNLYKPSYIRVIYRQKTDHYLITNTYLNSTTTIKYTSYRKENILYNLSIKEDIKNYNRYTYDFLQHIREISKNDPLQTK